MYICGGRGEREGLADHYERFNKQPGVEKAAFILHGHIYAELLMGVGLGPPFHHADFK